MKSQENEEELGKSMDLGCNAKSGFSTGFR
jgi:hypothetical protein